MTHECRIHVAYAMYSQTHHEKAGIKARSLPRAVSQQSQSSDPRRILRERRLGDAAGWLPGARGVLPALALLHLVMPDAWRQLYSAVRTFPLFQAGKASTQHLAGHGMLGRFRLPNATPYVRPLYVCTATYDAKAQSCAMA